MWVKKQDIVECFHFNKDSISFLVNECFLDKNFDESMDRPPEWVIENYRGNYVEFEKRNPIYERDMTIFKKDCGSLFLFGVSESAEELHTKITDSDCLVKHPDNRLIVVNSHQFYFDYVDFENFLHISKYLEHISSTIRHSVNCFLRKERDKEV